MVVNQQSGVKLPKTAKRVGLVFLKEIFSCKNNAQYGAVGLHESRVTFLENSTLVCKIGKIWIIFLKSLRILRELVRLKPAVSRIIWNETEDFHSNFL